MKTLHIAVVNKVATYTLRDGALVCGNKDYQISFTFDSEWDGITTKTARFIWGGLYYDQEFTGSTCQVPMITGTDEVQVGVYAGDLYTTTPAAIPCQRSILCGTDSPHPESGQNYSSEAKAAAEEAKASADGAKASAAEAKASATGLTVSAAEARAAADEAKTAAKNALTLTDFDDALAELAEHRRVTYAFDDWEVGSISPSGTFGNLSSTTRLRTAGYHQFPTCDKLRIVCELGYKALWHAYSYDRTTGVYTRVEGNTAFTIGAFEIPIVPEYFYRFLVAAENDRAVTTEFADHVQFVVMGDSKRMSGAEFDWEYGGFEAWVETYTTGRIRSGFIKADTGTLVTTAKYKNNLIVLQFDENKNYVGCIYGDGKWTNGCETKQDGYIRIVLSAAGGTYFNGSVVFADVISDVTVNLTLKGVSALQDTLPSYWTTYLAERGQDVLAERLKVGNHGDYFSFFTDYHYQSSARRTAAILRKVKHDHRIDTHFFGGDIFDSGYIATNAGAKAMTHRFAVDFDGLGLLPALGNHEVELYNSNFVNPTEAEVYALLFKQLENRNNVTLDPNLYYTYDNRPQKIRYIVLNTHNDVSNTFVNDTAQVNWFVARLTELEEGWNVVVLFHRYYDGVNASTGAHNVSPDGALIAALLNALNTKSTYTSAKYTFNFATAKAGVVAIISGHTHRDYSETAASGFPIIATRCDAYRGASQEITRALGDITEHAIDLFFVDTSARTIKTVRLGAGEDRAFTF